MYKYDVLKFNVHRNAAQAFRTLTMFRKFTAVHITQECFSLNDYCHVNLHKACIVDDEKLSLCQRLPVQSYIDSEMNQLPVSSTKSVRLANYEYWKEKWI